jgi:hypothetical protein
MVQSLKLNTLKNLHVPSAKEQEQKVQKISNLVVVVVLKDLLLVKLKMDMAKNINQRPYVPFAKVMEKQ